MKRVILALGLAVTSLQARRAGAAPSPEALVCDEHYQAAQVSRDNKKYLDAHAHLLKCVAPECPDLMRRDCVQWMGEVTAATPSIVIEMRGAPRETATVLIDGVRVAGALDGVSVNVDPGPRVLRIESPTTEPYESTLTVYEGEKLRKLTVALQPRRAAASAPAASSAETPTLGTRRRVGPLFYVAGASGGALVLTGGVFAVLGLTQRAHLSDRCGATGCPTSDVDAVRTKFLAADIMAGVGLLALGVAVVLYITSPESATATVMRP
jgi:hypothetical protein